VWKKITAPTLLVCFLWLVVWGLTSRYMYWLQQSFSRDVVENVISIETAARLQAVLWDLQALRMGVGEGVGAKTPQERQQQTVALEQTFGKLLRQAEDSTYSGMEHKIVRKIDGQFSIYANQVRVDLGAKGSDHPSGPSAAHDTKTLQMASDIGHLCSQLAEVNEQQIADSSIERSRLSNRIGNLRLAFVVAGPIVAILFGLWIARNLLRSMSQISVTLLDATGGLEHEVGKVEIMAPTDLPVLQEQVQLVAGRIRQVVEDLQEARDRVIRSERLAAVGELAAGVAHEIRNPLTSVKLLVQAAAQRYPESALSQRQLEVIQQEISRMESTIQGLLDFSRPAEVRRIRHDVRTTLQRALNLIEGRAKQQNVTIQEESPDHSLLMNGDPDLLHQVFVNLLLNGIESMEQGGILQVTVARDPVIEDECQIKICDGGTGIAPPVMERLFEPFVTSKRRGTGLGLAISRRIVGQHDGTLTAANRTEGGAMFIVRLPLASGDANHVDT
jgi:two-component system, NtrC family, sensor histidine kinase HydH